MMKTIVFVIVDLPSVYWLQKIKMLSKKSHYYNLINNVTKGIGGVYYFEWSSPHTVVLN